MVSVQNTENIEDLRENERFCLSEEQRAIFDEANRFAEKELYPLAEKMDAEEWWPEDVFETIGEAGYFGLTVPEEYGGQGLDLFTSGTGGTTVFGDVSALTADDDGNAVAHLSLQRVWWSCANGDGGDAFARLDEEDSDGDIPIITLIDSGYWDFREFGGIPADKSSNSNESDVNFVVAAAADSGNTYTCIAEFKKIY